MTAAAGIEVGGSHIAASGANKAPGAVAHEALRTGASSHGFLTAAAPQAESFRAGWQSQLAQLGLPKEALANVESEAEENGSTTVPSGSMPTTSQVAQGGTNPKVSPASSVASLLPGREMGKAGGEAQSPEPSQDALRVTDGLRVMEFARPQTVLPVQPQRAGSGKSDGVSTEQESHSANAIRPSHTVKEARPKSATVAVLPPTEQPAVIAAPVPVVPVALVAPASPVTPVAVRTPGSIHAFEQKPESTPENPTLPARNAPLQVDDSMPLPRQNTLQQEPTGEATSTARDAVVATVEAGNSEAGVRDSAAKVGDTAAIENAPKQPRTGSGEGLALAIPAYAAEPTMVEPSMPPALQSDPGLNSAPIIAHGREATTTLPANDAGDDRVHLAAASNHPLQSAVTPYLTDSSAPAQQPLPDGAGLVKAAAAVRLRPQRGSGGLDLTTSAGHLAQGPGNTPVSGEFALVRDGAGVRGGGVTNTGTATASPAPTGPDSRETFATLDAGGAAQPVWLHAGAHQAEAGFEDPALGWIGVRADASGGGVHAELLAGTADAVQSLGAQMAGLNAYLAEHHTPVETLTLSATGSGWAGLEGGMQQGAGEQRGQQPAETVQTGLVSDSSSERTPLPAPASQSPIMPVGFDAGAPPAWARGGRISVMA